MNSLIKRAGMIDSVQETLTPDLFDKNQKMHPHVRKHFMDELSTKIDLDKVEKFVLIGGLTSHKYSDTSDIDLSVYIKNPPEEWEGSEKSSLVSDISYQVLPGTKRMYQYYVTPWTKATSKGLANRSFGSYDIIADEWFTPPRPQETYADPEEKFKAELRVARHYTRQLDKLVRKWKEARRRYISSKEKRYTDPNWSPRLLTHYKRKAQYALKNLTEYLKDIGKERYRRYAMGWGIPRNARENVIYKLVQYGPHSELLYTLSRVELPAQVENINVDNIENQPEKKDYEKTASILKKYANIQEDKSNIKWLAALAGFGAGTAADVGIALKKKKAVTGKQGLYGTVGGFGGGLVYDLIKNNKDRN